MENATANGTFTTIDDVEEDEEQEGGGTPPRRAPKYRLKYRLDATGNALALELLDATTKEKDYVVLVTGTILRRNNNATTPEEEESTKFEERGDEDQEGIIETLSN